MCIRDSSKRGWIRALKGKIDDLSSVKFKDDDELALSLQCMTTDKIVLFATDGRAFTLMGDKLPSGRGLGEPIRLSIELPEEHDILDMFIPKENEKRIVASSKGYGFVMDEIEFLSQKRGGRNVLTLDAKQKARICAPVAGNFVAIVGENRKLLIFNIEELPNMARGKGVKLQSYKDGGTLDVLSFKGEDGLVCCLLYTSRCV